MGFWLFMLLMCLLIPVIMIAFGLKFKKTEPKEINFLFGYRTEMSMKNKETWEFAHRYLGKLWFGSGFVILAVSVIPMLFVIGKDKDIIGTAGTAITMLQLIPLLVSLVPVEKALKKEFDKDGNRKVK